jgi:hypothetical protein
MELQNNIMTKLNMRKIIKLGKKHGIRKWETECLKF